MALRLVDDPPSGESNLRGPPTFDKSDSLGTIVTVYQIGKPIKSAGPSSCAGHCRRWVMEMTCPWDCSEVKDTLMRIPKWPVLVCGWLLAAMIGQTVLAADPAGKFSKGLAPLEAGDDADDALDAGSPPVAAVPYRPAPIGPPGAAPAPDGTVFAPPAGGYAGAGLPAQNAWPETSPFTQHRVEEHYNDRGLWQYEADDNFACRRIFSLEYLYGHGAKPGNHVIGDPNFRNLRFDPDD